MTVDSLKGVTPVFPVPDVDVAPGARGPEDRWYGQREIEVQDPNGYVLVFAEQTIEGKP